MATGGEVQGQCPGGGSEDLHQLKCQPCLEDGNLYEAIGMCIDCQDYLCQKCFDIHTLPKPLRHHQLLDREQMLQSKTRASPKDTCTEKCSVHDDEIIKYYCTSHCLFGCTVCITLDHATCKGVHYIPQVAKELASNEDYITVEKQLRSALEAFKRVSENVEYDTERLETSYIEALKNIKEYHKKVDEVLNKIEADLIEKAQAIKSKEIKELALVSDTFKKAQEELQSALAKIDALQNANQNCSSYIEMMKTKEKLKSLDAQIQEAVTYKSNEQRKIKFSPNLETLVTLKNSFGILLGSATGTIVKVEHVQDINVKSGTDKCTCAITGLAVLPDRRQLIADYSNNTIKAVHLQYGQVLTQLKLSSPPWDIATISENNAAVTLPTERKVAIITVGNNSLGIDRKLDVNGTCFGIDYRNNKLAISFTSPHQVQVLNLQGTVLYTISVDRQGKRLFSSPHYLTFGQDDTTVYVSNFHNSNVVCVKMDGTVVATYTDGDLRAPLKPVVDSSGNILVCARDSYSVHQITTDCKKVRVLLTRADHGLTDWPYSIGLSEENDKLYAGMYSSNTIKVYKTERSAQ